MLKDTCELEEALHLVRNFAVTFTAVLGAFGAGAAAVTWLHRRAVHPIVEKWDAAIDLLNAQLAVNGGSSLLDKANRVPEIETKVDSAIERFDVYHEENLVRFDAIYKRLDDGDAALKELSAKLDKLLGLQTSELGQP